jgi:hypothetical protein
MFHSQDAHLLLLTVDVDTDHLGLIAAADLEIFLHFDGTSARLEESSPNTLLIQLKLKY